MNGHPPDHADEQQPTDAVGTREPPERPDPEDCPWCETDDALDTRLEASLSVMGGTRRPVIVHVTECSACGADRRVTVDVDRLGDDTDAVGGAWKDFPGQGTLEDHD